jgi:hypothetical protein
MENIRGQSLEDETGFETGSTLIVAMRKLANAGARVQVGLPPCRCGLINRGTNYMALIGLQRANVLSQGRANLNP